MARNCTRPLPAAPPGSSSELHPLTDLQRTAVGLVGALEHAAPEALAEVRTVAEALRFMGRAREARGS